MTNHTETSPRTQAPTMPFGPDVEAEPTSDGGSIVIRLGLSGIVSVEIIAGDESTEEGLLEQLHAARPVLELLHAGVGAEK